MMHLYHCPDCGRYHDEPASATFVLAVVCDDCALLAELEFYTFVPSDVDAIPAAA